MKPERPDVSRDRGRRDLLQEGSAYVVTLMLLLVLSIVGLSLTIVTQTEASIGSQERMIQSVYYAAEGGLNSALGRYLNRDLLQPVSYKADGASDAPGISSTQVDAQLRLIGESPCFMCEQSLQPDRKERTLLFLAASSAVRQIEGGSGDPVPMARKGLTWMVQASPVVLNDTVLNQADADNVDDLVTNY